MKFLDKLGWPVERVKGRPVLNALRLLIHTRRIVRQWKPPKQTWTSEECAQLHAELSERARNTEHDE